jgi:hypothetical protein
MSFQQLLLSCGRINNVCDASSGLVTMIHGQSSAVPLIQYSRSYLQKNVAVWLHRRMSSAERSCLFLLSSYRSHYWVSRQYTIIGFLKSSLTRIVFMTSPRLRAFQLLVLRFRSWQKRVVVWLDR